MVLVVPIPVAVKVVAEAVVARAVVARAVGMEELFASRFWRRSRRGLVALTNIVRLELSDLYSWALAYPAWRRSRTYKRQGIATVLSLADVRHVLFDVEWC